MKIALVHDSLAEFGGGERLVQALLELFPTADLYVGFFEPYILNKYFPGLSQKRIRTTLAQGTPLMSHTSLFQCFSPIIWRSISLDSYDLVVSSSSFLLCNLVNAKNSKHIQYIHSPPKNLIGLIPKTPLQKIIPYGKIIAPLYARAVVGSSNIIVNSVHMQKIMNDHFHVDAHVLYPPVRISQKISKRKKGEFFLMISRLDREKKIEVAIEACNILHSPLKIIGKSNDEAYERYLKEIAGPTIEFLGPKKDGDMEKYYSEARAFLFTSPNEDFGIAPVEAMAHGVPVVAYWGGGIRETLIDGVTGVSFKELTPNALMLAMKKAKNTYFSSAKMHAHAKRFSVGQFNKNLLRYIQLHLAV